VEVQFGGKAWSGGGYLGGCFLVIDGDAAGACM